MMARGDDAVQLRDARHALDVGEQRDRVVQEPDDVPLRQAVGDVRGDVGQQGGARLKQRDGLLRGVPELQELARHGGDDGRGCGQHMVITEAGILTRSRDSLLADVLDYCHGKRV